MSNVDNDDLEFTLDPEALGGADKNADRITESGAYIGVFKRVAQVRARDSDAAGLEWEFERTGSGGDATFTIYTKKKDGSTNDSGMAQVQALMYLMGVKELKPVPGKVRGWDDESKQFVEKDGKVYPDLCNKPVGVFLQKELTSKKNGADSFRWNLFGQYQAETRLTVSELRDRKTKPEKFDKYLRGLKDKDNRKASAAEPDQPSMGASNYDGV